jgi:hypothetical protein
MKNKSFIVFLVITLILTSCEKSSDRDQSLAPEEYIDTGMPDHSKLWNLQDYSTACEYLDNLKTFKPLSLPRKNSKKSGVYFSRIINPENLSFLQDESIPLNERALQIQQYVEIQGLLISIYTDINNTEQYYKRELIDLYIFGLTIAQNMLDLGNIINESVDEEDIKMQDRFHSIKNLYIKMVLFVLENQRKTTLFEEKDLIRLTDFISNSLSVNLEWLEPDAVEVLKQRIQEVIDNTTSEQIKNKYNLLVEEL